MDEKRLLELKEYYRHKRNRHKVRSNHYWRYNGKIEAINDVIQELRGNRINFGSYSIQANVVFKGELPKQPRIL